MDERENLAYEILLIHAPKLSRYHHIIAALVDPDAFVLLLPAIAMAGIWRAAGKEKGHFSRGHITTSFVGGGVSAEVYAKLFVRHMRGSRFKPFNAIFGDEDGAVFVSNRGRLVGGKDKGDGEGYMEVRRLEKGKVYGLSNGGLDEEWGKVERGRKIFEDLLRRELGSYGGGEGNGRGEGVEMMVEECMGDTEACRPAVTGCGDDMERWMGRVRIPVGRAGWKGEGGGEIYGTRTTTVMVRGWGEGWGKTGTEVWEKDWVDGKVRRAGAGQEIKEGYE